jgi:hypothetical protein
MILQVRIVKELWACFAEVRILRDLDLLFEEIGGGWIRVTRQRVS